MAKSMVTAALVLSCGMLACTETQVAGITQPATRTSPGAVRLRGTVDVAAGTLTFEQVGSNPELQPNSGISAAVYGNQGVTVRIYNSPVVVSAPVAGKKTYSANVGIRNLLSYRIGDEQGAAAPPDTLGIQVFMNAAVVVSGTSSPCPACAVTVKNASGVATFTAPNQQYWFWPELLGPANGGADTTRARRSWVFEADTQVTRFNFDVLVSAPWVAPNDTRFKVSYEADSLPDTQSKPRWRVQNTGTNTWTASGGLLTLSSRGGQLGFYRRDSVGTTENAYIEGSMKWNTAVSGNDQMQIGFADGTRLIALAVYGTRASFVSATGAALGTATNVTTTTSHRYQLRKYAADSAVYYIDGVRGQKLAYGSFSADPYTGTSPLVLFGQQSFSTTTIGSSFDYATYELGVALP